MKEFVISETKTEYAVLVGLITPQQSESKTREYLDELEFLADTAGAVTVRRFTQRVNGPSSVTYIGKGKLEEIRRYIEDCEERAERGEVYYPQREENKPYTGDTPYSQDDAEGVEPVPYQPYSRYLRHESPDSQRQDTGGAGPIQIHAPETAKTVDSP